MKDEGCSEHAKSGGNSHLSSVSSLPFLRAGHRLRAILSTYEPTYPQECQWTSKRSATG
jgi:hypothetical protein